MAGKRWNKVIAISREDLVAVSYVLGPASAAALALADEANRHEPCNFYRCGSSIIVSPASHSTQPAEPSGQRLAVEPMQG